MAEKSYLKIAGLIALGIHLLFIGIIAGVYGRSHLGSGSYVRVRLLPFGGGGSTGISNGSPVQRNNRVKEVVRPVVSEKPVSNQETLTASSISETQEGPTGPETQSGDEILGNGGSGSGSEISGKLFGGNGIELRYAKQPVFTYPSEARQKGYEGEVILRLEVLSNGRVGQVKIKKSSGHTILDSQALTDAKYCKFVSDEEEKNILPLWVSIPVKFQLQ